MSSADVTRRRLLDQARVAFAEKGHDGVSIQRDVLGPSGVSNGSFYHQFADKTELLVAVLEDGAQSGRSQVGEAFSAVDVQARGAGHLAAQRAFEAWFDLVDDAEDLFRIQLRERQNPDARVRSLVAGFRERWIATFTAFLRTRGFPDPGRAARLVAMLNTGILMEYLDTSKDERRALRAEITQTLPAFVTGGVASLSGPDATT
jgi:AcrR family transcriptional regulator